MIVLSHEKRENQLKRLLNFTLSKPPPSLKEIIISWGSNQSSLKKIVESFRSVALEFGISIRFWEEIDLTVNRRFWHAKEIFTFCLLSIDDDILMNYLNLEYGFAIWRNYPDQLVGYCSRYIIIQKYAQNSILKYRYSGNHMRLILTGLAFLNRDIAISYYKPFNSKNIGIVKLLNNCEDILMNFIAMNLSHKPAIFINRVYLHLSSHGISTKPGHSHIRDFCLNSFYSFFKELPLKIPKEFIFQ